MAKKSFKGGGADLFFTDTPTPNATSTPVKDLKINESFRKLIPPLSHEEYSQLEENLLENGIREAISIWQDIIIDGHNRYEIAQRHNLPFVIVSYDFKTETDVILWIIKNQFGRRNLTAYDRSVLALRLKPVIAEKAKENQGTRSDLLQNSAKSSDTRKELAEIAGVSHDTIAKVEKIEKSATPEILKKLKSGDISIHRAYQETKQQEKNEHPENNNPSAKLSVSHKIKPDILSKYFDSSMSNADINAIIDKALEEYFKNGGNQQ
jgi:transcriptional regulator with XRE-family HTH domain